MKKSGLNPTENQRAAEQSFGGDNEFAAGDDQFTTEDNQFTTEDNQFSTGDEQYAAGDNNQYAPEDTEYSEEYQYTWDWAGRRTAEVTVETWNDTQQPAPLTH